jgi:hypothetical protein
MAFYEGKPIFVLNNVMRKKTLKEIRATARERQRRWRDKNQVTHRERVAEVYGRSKAQARYADGVTPQELRRYGLKEEGKDIGLVDLPLRGQAELIQETYYAMEEGVDTGYKEPKEKGGREYARGVVSGVGGSGDGGEGIEGGDGSEERGAAEGVVGGIRPALGSGGAGEGVEGADSEGVRGGSGGVSETANERATYARLGELIRKREEVEVEM